MTATRARMNTKASTWGTEVTAWRDPQCLHFFALDLGSALATEDGHA